MWNEPLKGSHIGSLAGKIINVPDENYRIKIDRTIDVYENEAEYFFSAAYRHVWMPYMRKMVLQRLFCQYPACLKKPVVIKEPNGSLFADIILQLFPNAKTIFLVRDGRDVAASVLDIFRKGSWANKWMRFPVLDEERGEMWL
ncbi:MAG: sulfotransferase [Nitrospiraceae bacterium]|nr:sulfotransferase [Nitrospiraceae bacterium]